jgi:hypothetical protein
MAAKGWKQRVHERISKLGTRFKAGSKPVVVTSGNNVAVYKPEFIEAVSKPITRLPKKDYSSIIKGSSMQKQMIAAIARNDSELNNAIVFLQTKNSSLLDDIDMSTLDNPDTREEIIEIALKNRWKIK